MKNYILNSKIILYRSIIILLFSYLGGENEHLTINESTFWIKKIKANIDFSGGLITIRSSNSSNEIHGFIEYNPELFQPNLEFSSVSRTGIIDLSTNFDFDFDFGSNYEEYENRAKILLPTSKPIKFNMDYSLATVDINLEDIEVSSFNFDLGMGSAVIDIGGDSPNQKCNFLTIDIGMGSANIKQLGNLYCEESEIECGMGSIVLDFSGKIKKNIEYDISVGMGSVDILIQKGINAIFETNQTLLSSLDVEDMVLIKDDVYRNEDYDESQPTLNFQCSIGLGSISLKWIK